ncbi:mCG148345 [Mus musculus]|nr:mCG148345 [Mus musculus]
MPLNLSSALAPESILHPESGVHPPPWLLPPWCLSPLPSHTVSQETTSSARFCTVLVESEVQGRRQRQQMLLGLQGRQRCGNRH